MDSFHLHFKHGKQPDLPLIPGANPICRGAHGVTLAAGTAKSTGTLGQFRLDDRGLWLHLAESAQGVHVNGRPVHRLALLRSGDTLHLDAQEIQVVGRSGIRSETSAEPGSRTGNTILLRGIGGVHHGRSYPLHRPCTLGNDKDADIRLEEGSAPGILVQLEPDGESLRLQLRSQEGAGTLQVNGREVRQARLYCGDQLTLGAQSRFVVETPWPLKLHADTRGETGARREKQRAAAGQSLPPALPSRRWPWLLLVAGLLGGLLCVLLLFGAK